MLLQAVACPPRTDLPWLALLQVEQASTRRRCAKGQACLPPSPQCTGHPAAAGPSFSSEMPFLRIKDWLNPGNVAVVRLCVSFSVFLASATVHVGASLPARMFWYDEATRMEVTASNYAAFFSLCCGESRRAMDLYVFSSADKRSPPGTPSVVGGTVKSRSSSSSCPMQEEFRACVMNRDGLICVLCRATPNVLLLEAAHIVPFESSIGDCMRYGLPAVNEVRNGIMLCKVCHYLFDR